MDILRFWIGYGRCGSEVCRREEGNTANTFQLPAYQTVGASISTEYDGYKISLHGKNLTDETYIEWISWGDMAMFGEPTSYELSLVKRI